MKRDTTKRTVTFSSVESFTGGAFSAKVVRKKGASKFWKGALVTYANEMKERLGVDTSKGVVNRKVAKEMALAGKEFFKSDFCVAFTGNAGPQALDGKRVGLVYIAINEAVYERLFTGGRKEIILQAVEFAYGLMRELQAVS